MVEWWRDRRAGMEDLVDLARWIMCVGMLRGGCGVVLKWQGAIMDERIPTHGTEQAVIE